MNFFAELSLKNLKRKPLRTFALSALVALLSFVLFGGTLLVTSLKNGLDSYSARLGADVVVVPNAARSEGQFEDVLLQGIPGNFYMSSSKIDKIEEVEGIDKLSPQFFLASTSASCCSASVQIIGFDPDTDFSVLPWVNRKYGGSIGDGDIVVGSEISVTTSGKLKFYNVECNVVATLERTGTGLDTAVYANMNTIKQMAKSAKELGFTFLDGVNVDKSVSAIMIKVKSGYDAESVAAQINIAVTGIRSGSSTSYVSGVAGGLDNVSGIIGALSVMIWVLSVVILGVSLFAICNERGKEFAVLRAMGASKKSLYKLIIVEISMLSAVGAAVGVILSGAFILPFGAIIRRSLQMPYLVPEWWQLALFAVAAVVISVLTGVIASLFSVKILSKNDAGLMLREDA